MLDLCTHREPRLQKNLFAPGPHRIQAKATKHKSSILDKFSFSLSHLRYQIKYKINYKKTGRPGWDDQFLTYSVRRFPLGGGNDSRGKFPSYRLLSTSY